MRAPPAGRPTPKMAGDRPEERRAPTQELDLMAGAPCNYSFNITGAVTLASMRTFTVWEVVVRSWVVC